MKILKYLLILSLLVFNVAFAQNDEEFEEEQDYSVEEIEESDEEADTEVESAESGDVAEVGEPVSGPNEKNPFKRQIRKVPGDKSKIHHPLAKEGLRKITKNKVYIYETEVSEQSKSSSFRLGIYSPSELANTQVSPNVFFGDIYDQTDMPMLMYDYEWDVFSSLGKLSLKVGTGLYVAVGTGIRSRDSTPAREEFTFLMFPFNAGVVWKAQFWDTQTIVPYVEGGGDYIVFSEIRDDGSSPKFGGSLAAHVAGGAALNLNSLDRDAIIELDREYGINNIWLLAEYRALIGIQKDFDFSGNFINIGFLLDF